MDQITHSVRAEYWKDIIERCQGRAGGQSAKAWLMENDISEKSYYYWLRKFRKAAFREGVDRKAGAAVALPVPVNDNPLSVAEIPAEELYSSDSSAAIMIKSRKMTVEISSAISESAIVELVKAVAHAV